MTGAANAVASESVSPPSTSLTALMSPLFSASDSEPVNVVSLALAVERLSAVEFSTLRMAASCLSASAVVLFRSPNELFSSAALALNDETVPPIELEMLSSCGLSWLSKSDLMPLTDDCACCASCLICWRSCVVPLTFASMFAALVFSDDARSLSCVMVASTLVFRCSMAIFAASGSRLLLASVPRESLIFWYSCACLVTFDA